MEKKKLKFGITHLSKSTPKFLKRLGNSLLAVSVFISGYAFYNAEPIIGVSGLVCGIVGTLLCNMFSDAE